MIAIVQEMAAANVNPPNDQLQPPPESVANAVTNNAVQTEMLQLLRAITVNNSNGGR